jgi:hypothetical protein
MYEYELSEGGTENRDVRELDGSGSCVYRQQDSNLTYRNELFVLLCSYGLLFVMCLFFLS